MYKLYVRIYLCPNIRLQLLDPNIEQTLSPAIDISIKRAYVCMI